MFKFDGLNGFHQWITARTSKKAVPNKSKPHNEIYDRIEFPEIKGEECQKNQTEQD